MGKDVTTVSSVTLNIAEANPEPLQKALLSSITNGTQLVEAVIKSLLTDMGILVRQGQRYAKSTYALGLPTGATRPISNLTDALLEPIIIAEHGLTDGLLIISQFYTDVNAALLSFPYLEATYGYNFATGEVDNSGYVFPLVCLEVADVGGESSSEECISSRAANADEKRVRVTSVAYNGSTGQVVATFSQELFTVVSLGTTQVWSVLSTWTDSFPLQNPNGYIIGELALFVIYRPYDNLGVLLDPEYWSYVVSTGTHPEITPPVTETTDEYLPVIPVRYNNKDLTDPDINDTSKGSLFDTATELCKRMKMNYRNFALRINENDQIEFIDHCYVMFGANIQSNQKSVLWYLNEYFSYLSQYQVSTGVPNISFLTNSINPIEGNDYNIMNPLFRNAPVTDGFTEYGLNLTVSYSQIITTILTGVIGDGKLGDSLKAYVPYQFEVCDTGGGDGAEEACHFETRYHLQIDTQITKTQYRRVVVVNLVTNNLIYNGYGVYTTMTDIATDPNNNNMVIPLQFQMAETFNLLQENALFADTLLMVINTWDVQNLAWWQTGAFRMILIFVAIVITVLTWGTTAAYWAALVQAVGSVYLAAVIVIAIYVALDFAFKWLITELGTDFAIIAAVLAVVAAVVFKVGGQSILVGVTEAGKELTLSFASIAMMGAGALMNAAGFVLQKEYDTILADYQNYQDDLGAAYDDLNSKIDEHITVISSDIMHPLRRHRMEMIIANDGSPSNFFFRTLQLISNSTYGIHDELPNYVTNALRKDMNIPQEQYNPDRPRALTA